MTETGLSGGAVIVQKLHLDEDDDLRPLKVDDLPTSFFNRDFTDTKEFIEPENEEEGEALLRAFQHQKGDRPIRNARYVQVYNKDLEDCNLPLFRYKEDRNGNKVRVMNREGTLREVYDRFGPGCYNVYVIGGQPPVEYITRRTWIERV